MNKLKNLEEFCNLLNMLKGTVEDYNVGIEIIKNLDLHDDYHILMGKCLNSSTRIKYINDMFNTNPEDAIKTGWKTHIPDSVLDTRLNVCKIIMDHEQLTLDSLHERLKVSNDQTVKDIFNYIMLNLVKSIYKEVDYLKDIKIEIKW